MLSLFRSARAATRFQAATPIRTFAASATSSDEDGPTKPFTATLFPGDGKRRRRRAAAGGGRRRRLLWAPRRPPPVDVDPASRAPCVDDNNVASVGAFGGRQGEVPGRGGEEGAEEEGEEGGEEERRRREAALLPTRHPPFSFSKTNKQG